MQTGPGLGVEINEDAIAKYAAWPRGAMMRRREFIGGVLLTSAAAAVRAGALSQAADQNPEAPGRIKVTGMKTIGVTWEPNTDRPYVFVKLETDAGIVGWGEATLEGKAGA